MSGITLVQAQANLDKWVATDLGVADRQSYKVGDRWFTAVDAGEIRRNIQFWAAKVQELDPQVKLTISVSRIVPNVR